MVMSETCVLVVDDAVAVRRLVSDALTAHRRNHPDRLVIRFSVPTECAAVVVAVLPRRADADVTPPLGMREQRPHLAHRRPKRGTKEPDRGGRTARPAVRA